MKKKTKKILMESTGLVALCGTVIGSLFDTQEELLNRQAETTGDANKVVTGGAMASNITDIEIPSKLTVKDKARLLIWRLPQPVQTLLIMPLWAIGRGIIFLFGLLGHILSPFATYILNGILHILILFFAIYIFYKLLFPDGKITDLLKKNRWMWFVGGGVLLAVADALLETYFQYYPLVRIGVLLVLAFFAILLIKNRVFRHLDSPVSKKYIHIPSTI